MSLFEKKLADKKQAEFLVELQKANKKYVESLNNINEQFGFVSFEEGGRQQALDFVRKSLEHNEYRFYAPYAGDLNRRVPEICKKALLDKALDIFLEKGSLNND